KLFILDPVGASWDTIGADAGARDAVRVLADAGVLELVSPTAVLTTYETAIVEGIRRDLADRDFLDLCETHSQATGKQRWTQALAKVPQDVQTDQAMRHLLSDVVRGGADVAAAATDDYLEHRQTPSNLSDNRRHREDYAEYAGVGRAFNENRDGYGGTVAYRY